MTRRRRRARDKPSLVSHLNDPKTISSAEASSSVSLDRLSELVARRIHEGNWGAPPKRETESGSDAGATSGLPSESKPFDELSHAERNRACQAARQTLEAVLALGCQIQTSAQSQSLSAATTVEAVQQTIAHLKLQRPALNELRKIWENREPNLWRLFPEIYVILSERAIKKSEPFLGHDVADEGLKAFPSNLRLRQLQALALAQSGAPKAANRILRALEHEGHEDAETLGLLARTHKDFWRLASDSSQRESELRQAYGYYLRGFQKSGDYYPGINAATLALLLGQRGDAERLAREVRRICLEEIRGKGSSYWGQATLAEACLILGDVDQARENYLAAVSVGRADWTSVGSTRRQARLLAKSLLRDAHRLDDCFHISPVVVFSGHMIDAPGRAEARFPSQFAGQVKAEIHARLKQWNAKIGYASAACGSDILFLEALLDLEGEIHIVLPFSLQDFRRLSVEIDSSQPWGSRLDRVLERAASVTYAAQHGYAGNPIVFEYVNQLLLGLAMLRCQVLDAELRPLAVWDGKAVPDLGGTAHCVQIWKGAKLSVEIIDLSRRVAHASKTPAPSVVDSGVTPPSFGALQQEIRAMLFADVVGYSKMDETEIPIYMQHFMGKVAALLKATAHPPSVKNTWGDAFYMVFDTVRDAGLLALELRDMIGKTNWREVGLIKALNVRIGLHAGPVFAFHDPVLDQPTYTGSHVSRAARIEPIAEEGQIYSSEPFAALTAASGVKEFVCDYVGERSLAKKYGAARIYLIREKSLSEGH